MPEPLKYVSYGIVFQEVPNEISLAINISGCSHKCEGCHSEYLWEYKGNYLKNDLDLLIDRYFNYITCVCFMGGDQNIKELYSLCEYIKNHYKLKTCIYSGVNSIDVFKEFLHNKILDYLKIGSYKKDLGDLTSSTTNQKIFLIENGILTDITKNMRKKYE